MFVPSVVPFMPFPRRILRGGATLMLVLVLAAGVVMALAAHYRGIERESVANRERAAGEIIAHWFMATHRASLENDFSNAIAGDGVELDSGELRSLAAAPPGLPDIPASIPEARFGLLDDGNGVAMAFVVVRDVGERPALRHGLIGGGLADVGFATGAGERTGRHLSAIENLIGVPLDANDLVATADLAIPVRADLVYRNRQPGRPWLNRMETPMDAGARAIVNTGEIGAVTVATVNDVVAADVRGTGDASASTGRSAGTLQGTSLTADSLQVVGLLVVGSLLADDDVTTATARIGEKLQAEAVTATQLDAQLVTSGAQATVHDSAAIQQIVSGAFDSDRITTVDSTSSGLWGPLMEVDSTLTVSGACDGC